MVIYGWLRIGDVTFFSFFLQFIYGTKKSISLISFRERERKKKKRKKKRDFDSRGIGNRERKGKYTLGLGPVSCPGG
jgi:hypothetical protein